jgi:hypothetical protein
MNPEKTKEHEPTAVKKRTWDLVDQDSTQQIQNKHMTRMIKGIARVSETVS